MSVGGVVEDLIALQRLAEQERDAVRRRSLEAIRGHVAERDDGAKVGEAAQVLGVSAPTVRAWIKVGALRTVARSSPLRVDVTSLAATKSVLEELRRHRDDGRLLSEVLRVLRDRAVLAGDDVAASVDDLAAGRVRRLDAHRLDELLPTTRTQTSTSS